MRSLYSKFVLLGIVFIVATLLLHGVQWIRSDSDAGMSRISYLARLRDRLAGGPVHLPDPLPFQVSIRQATDRQNSPDVASLTANQNRDVSEFHDVQKPSSNRRKSATGHLPFIYDTDSGFDRIPEQMKFVPQRIKDLKGIGGVRHQVILLDSSPEQWNVKSGVKTFIEHKCPVRTCKLLSAQAVPANTTVDAVLFGQDVWGDLSVLEKHRHNGTVLIFFALESPMATRSYAGFNNIFNWTATYRWDSTIVAPYERWKMFDNATLPAKALKNYAKGKTKGAAIFVSNCGASNGRLEMARELGQYYPVDIYGACGTHKCHRGDDGCFRQLNEDYRFYLAFENANCRDYISEKFFVNGLGNDVIPIAMGARPEEYRRAAPPHSFIHVEDFPDVKSLAEYLKKLEKNDDLYNDYFRWKGTGEFLNTFFWCRLCALVSDENKPRLVVDDLEAWWRGNDTCRFTRWSSKG